MLTQDPVEWPAREIIDRDVVPEALEVDRAVQDLAQLLMDMGIDELVEEFDMKKGHAKQLRKWLDKRSTAASEPDRPSFAPSLPADLVIDPRSLVIGTEIGSGEPGAVSPPGVRRAARGAASEARGWTTSAAGREARAEDAARSRGAATAPETSARRMKHAPHVLGGAMSAVRSGNVW